MRKILGYICAVLAASGATNAVLLVGNSRRSGYPVPLVDLFALWRPQFLLGLIAGIIPLLLVKSAGYALRLSSALYFTLCGAGIACLGGAVMICAASPLPDFSGPDEETLTFFQSYLRGLAAFAGGGGLGGWTYWFIAERSR